MTWHDKFMGLAHHVARWSKDPSTQVGAVVVGDSPRQVAFGYNGFPPGIADDERLNDRDEKLALVIHAEVNALLNAPFKPVWLYSTKWPCSRCAVHIVAAGVRWVVAPYPAPDDRWHADAARSAQVLEEAGVNTVLRP